jgi:hypothetical protein
MNFLSLFITPLLAVCVCAFHGRLEASQYYYASASLIFQNINLVDYYTGSTYTGTLNGGFNNCVSQQCYIT